MENVNSILEKLMLNRTALLLKRYDEELKAILESDLQAYRSHALRNVSNNSRASVKSRLVA